MIRFDLISPREGKDGKTRWLKVGAAFPRDKGGFSLVLDALPLPDKEGNVRLLMSEPLPRDDAPRHHEQQSNHHNRSSGAPEDEIPF